MQALSSGSPTQSEPLSTPWDPSLGVFSSHGSGFLGLLLRVLFSVLLLSSRSAAPVLSSVLLGADTAGAEESR